MKKVLLIIASILSTAGVFAQGTIANANFESWTGTAGSGFEKPGSWKTTNDTINNGLAVAGNVFKESGTTNVLGISSIKLTTKRYTVSLAPLIQLYIPGIAVSGGARISIVPTFSIHGGYPFVDRPDSIKGNWSIQQGLGTDTAAISVLLSRWNTLLNKRDTIGYVIKKQRTTTLPMAAFSDTIHYFLGGAPDTCTVTLMSSTSFPGLDTTNVFFVDNLSFAGIDSTDYTPPGIGYADHKAPLEISVFPNPANNNVTFSGLVEGTLMLSNIIGQNVLAMQVDKSTIKVDLSKFEKGLYIYRFSPADRSESITGRIVINR